MKDDGDWRVSQFAVSRAEERKKNVFVHKNNYKHSVDVLKISHTTLSHTFSPFTHSQPPPGFSYHTMQTNEPSD